MCPTGMCGLGWSFCRWTPGASEYQQLMLQTCRRACCLCPVLPSRDLSPCRLIQYNAFKELLGSGIKAHMQVYNYTLYSL